MRAMLSFTACDGSFMPSAARPAGADIANSRPIAVVRAEVANNRRYILALSVARLRARMTAGDSTPTGEGYAINKKFLAGATTRRDRIGVSRRTTLFN